MIIKVSEIKAGTQLAEIDGLTLITYPWKFLKE